MALRRKEVGGDQISSKHISTCMIKYTLVFESIACNTMNFQYYQTFQKLFVVIVIVEPPAWVLAAKQWVPRACLFAFFQHSETMKRWWHSWPWGERDGGRGSVWLPLVKRPMKLWFCFSTMQINDIIITAERKWGSLCFPPQREGVLERNNFRSQRGFWGFSIWPWIFFGWSFQCFWFALLNNLQWFEQNSVKMSC